MIEIRIQTDILFADNICRYGYLHLRMHLQIICICRTEKSSIICPLLEIRSCLNAAVEREALTDANAFHSTFLPLPPPPPAVPACPGIVAFIQPDCHHAMQLLFLWRRRRLGKLE